MGGCGIAFLIAAALAQDAPPPASPAPPAATAPKPAQAEGASKRLADLVHEYDEAQRVFEEKYGAAKDDAEREKVFRSEYPAPETFAPRFAALARELKSDPVALQAWTWIVQRVQSREWIDTSLEAIVADHVESPKLLDVVQAVSPYAPTLSGEKLLRAAIAKSPHWDVKGHATYKLAQVLGALASTVDALGAKGGADGDEARNAIVSFYGKEMVAELEALEPAEMRKEAEDLFEDVVANFKTVKSAQGTLGQQAEAELWELRNLAIGRVVPEVIGQDLDGTPFKLSDYRGKVVVLDFWGFW